MKKILVFLIVFAFILANIPISVFADDTPSFKGLNDPAIEPYLESTLYDSLVSDLDSSDYFVENIEAIYISEEYLEELEYNSQENIYFGYALSQLDEQFAGKRYVFTLGEHNETVVKEFEAYDEEYYNTIIHNVSVGTGVILVCVTVSVVTAGAGAPAASMIFAVAAKSGAVAALSGAALGGVAAGVVTGYKTGDMNESLKAAALAGSEGFKWGAITGAVSGGATEAFALKGATLNGLTMNEAAEIQRESKYPIDVIKQFHTKEEYEVFKAANLKPHIVSGKTALVRNDINLNLKDEFGHTNLERMKAGLSPLDATGNPFELHHIGQKADATLSILTKTEHDNAALHGFKAISEIDRNLFASQRKNFWIEMARLLEGGLL